MLYKYAEELREKAPELGLQDADITLKLDKPELRVEIDRERAANLGVDTEDIATALRIMVGGEERVTRFRDESMNGITTCRCDCGKGIAMTPRPSRDCLCREKMVVWPASTTW